MGTAKFNKAKPSIFNVSTLIQTQIYRHEIPHNFSISSINVAQIVIYILDIINCYKFSPSPSTMCRVRIVKAFALCGLMEKACFKFSFPVRLKVGRFVKPFSMLSNIMRKMLNSRNFNAGGLFEIQ